ncbi:DUF1428 domain-containing protein [Lentibacter sp. XHP0401]|jgi:uncharacterized protein YbaA (DUF1428 family)|uniref:DUF1428 domain-containing protein n=1 Tax=Lentibacter sp. XHP0401 TaxID=2984334 RepID=UPI0021E7EA97|nr:DUF1428 domain-containing protein [Lentibacter sp. XHP0401]MCV2891477.1 DUF1428 domain-containing protein [Lentibacter sp. XHP0401]
MTYISGFVAAVPAGNKAEYVEHAKKSWPIFKKYGALRMVETWGDEVPDGKVTSFPMAVKLTDGETVVFSWIEWPDKAASDACMSSMQTDPEWEALGDMPFDGKRMIFGGFEALLDCSAGEA